MRPRRVLLVHDPIPLELYSLISYSGQFYFWHIRIVCEVIVALSKLHLRGESDAVALAVVYMEASQIEFMASPEQTTYLRQCYGGSNTKVTMGLLQFAANYLGFDISSLTLSSPSSMTIQDTEPLVRLGLEGSQMNVRRSVDL